MALKAQQYQILKAKATEALGTSLLIIPELRVLVLTKRHVGSGNEIGAFLVIFGAYTPNANMADHSVVARDELHESEVSQSSMFYFDNASPEKSYFIVDLFCFISLCLRVAVFLNATRKDRNLPPFTSKGK